MKEHSVQVVSANIQHDIDTSELQLVLPTPEVCDGCNRLEYLGLVLDPELGVYSNCSCPHQGISISLLLHESFGLNNGLLYLQLSVLTVWDKIPLN